MGAAMISVLAGAQILRLPPGPLLAAVNAMVAGSSVVLWAFGTWLIPSLAFLGLWRHVLCRIRWPTSRVVEHRVPRRHVRCGQPRARYRAARAVAGDAADDESWPALAIWVLALLAMAIASLRNLGRIRQ